MLIQPIAFIPTLLELGKNGGMTIYYFSYDIKRIHTIQSQL